MIRLGPGFHHDIAAEDYHADPCADPSLSSSLAKVLVTRSPAHAKAAHPRLTPSATRKAKRRLDFGSGAHAILLGRGAEIVVIAAESYTTKAAREARDMAIETHKIPLLEPDYEHALAMVDVATTALAEEGLLGAFEFAAPEVVAIARDPTGVSLRAMLDKLSPDCCMVWDYKTTDTTAHPDALGRKIADMGYEIQAGFYERVLGQIDRTTRGRVEFRWLFQETEPPYAVTFCTLDGVGREIGRRKVAYAIDLWSRGIETGLWPGYPPGIHRVTYPEWEERRWLDAEMRLSEAGVTPAFEPGSAPPDPREIIFGETHMRLEDEP